VRETPLPQRAGEDFVEGTDQPRRTVGGPQDRIVQTAGLQIAQEVAAARGVFLGGRREPQQHFLPARRDPPGGQHRLPRLTEVHPFGDAVDEQGEDRMHRQIAGGKGLVIAPQPFGELADRSARQPAVSTTIRKRLLFGALQPRRAVPVAMTVAAAMTVILPPQRIGWWWNWQILRRAGPKQPTCLKLSSPPTLDSILNPKF